MSPLQRSLHWAHMLLFPTGLDWKLLTVRGPHPFLYLCKQKVRWCLDYRNIHSTNMYQDLLWKGTLLGVGNTSIHKTASDSALLGPAWISAGPLKMVGTPPDQPVTAPQDQGGALCPLGRALSPRSLTSPTRGLHSASA